MKFNNGIDRTYSEFWRKKSILRAIMWWFKLKWVEIIINNRLTLHFTHKLNSNQLFVPGIPSPKLLPQLTTQSIDKLKMIAMPLRNSKRIDLDSTAPTPPTRDIHEFSQFRLIDLNFGVFIRRSRIATLELYVFPRLCLFDNVRLLCSILTRD